MIIDFIQNMISYIWPCKHVWEQIDEGPLEHGGHSLAAGARVGTWKTFKCNVCQCKRHTRELI